MAQVKTDVTTINELLGRGTVNVIDRENLEKKLRSGKPLRIKFGIDPTGPDVHLGHSVPLRKLRQFQKAGHKIIIIIGDWTARIGDPTDRNEMRPQLSAKEVKINAKKYLNQLYLILDQKKTKIVWQSEWFDKFNLQSFFALISKWTVAQLLDRDDFKKRLADGIEVGYHEPIYTLLQAYDSVMVKADVEIGATEQLFNMLRGRDMQSQMNQTPQDILTMELLLGLYGQRKMGKSHNNYIGLLDSAENMYGKIMSIPDELIISYFELTTDLSEKEISKMKKLLDRRAVNPRDLKMKLAKKIVTAYKSLPEATRAEKDFVQVFQKKKLPETIETYPVKNWPNTIATALVDTKLAGSMSEARRLVEQGGIKINGRIEKNPNAKILQKKEVIISRGKRFFRKLKLQK